jgi:hypothetical protein
MLRICSADGCTIRTLGELCSFHEPEPERTEWPRGRPFELRGQTGQLNIAHVEAERLRHPDSILELSP